jgi:hypothetical protein
MATTAASITGSTAVPQKYDQTLGRYRPMTVAELEAMYIPAEYQRMADQGLLPTPITHIGVNPTTGETIVWEYRSGQPRRMVPYNGPAFGAPVEVQIADPTPEEYLHQRTPIPTPRKEITKGVPTIELPPGARCDSPGWREQVNEITGNRECVKIVVEPPPGLTDPTEFFPPPPAFSAGQDPRGMTLAAQEANVSRAQVGLDPANLGASGFDLLGAITGGLTGLITGGPAGALVGGVTGGFGQDLTGGGATGGRGAGLGTGTGSDLQFGLPSGITAGCPSGYKQTASGCQRTGLVGMAERIIPGGATGTIPMTNGTGMYGAISEAPMVFQSQRRQCRAGMVLGRDGMCYVAGGKAGITNRQRMYPKPTAPLLTGGERKTLRRARALEGKVKRAWMAAGKPGQRRTRRK